MKITADKIICMLIIAMMTGGIVFVSILQKDAVEDECCNATQIEIVGQQRFITEREIKEGIKESVGPVIGVRTDSVKLSEIEAAVDDISAVLKSQVWLTTDGTLHVRVTQREPVLRFTGLGKDRFIDKDGCIFPSPDSCKVEVPVIFGDLPVKLAQGLKGHPSDEKEQIWVQDIILMASYLKENAHMTGLVEKIRVEKNGELVMSTAGDGPTVLFGQPDDIESKFSRLDKYFKQVEPVKGAGHYSSINLKYEGQLICTQ